MLNYFSNAPLGILDAHSEAISQALDLARRAENKTDEYDSLAYQAYGYFLTGRVDVANDVFKRAETLKREVGVGIQYLHSHIGMLHAECLLRSGDIAYARRVMNANLERNEQRHLLADLFGSHRVLGDIDSDEGDHLSARAHYESALKIARSISARDVLIEALLARGRWQAKHMKAANAAFSDLNEALGYCVESGYRIYEADTRVALAWAYLAGLTPDPSPSRRGEILTKAKESAERALQMSKEMGYYWGKVDAEGVLKVIGD